tara:strand:+ start:2987 stop:4189 length:1203 start_codon:yes stop_codon:yes gene_type:complete
MADGYGTPIRLIFDDPKAMERAGYANGMELNATSMALSVERRVGGMPMPLSKGKRFGLDLNTVNSTIIIDAVFVDDDHNRRASTARKASGQIDTTQTFLTARAVGEKTTIAVTTYALIVGSLELKDSIGTTHSITIVSTSSTKGYVSGTSINLGTSGTGFVTAAELATALVACINANTGTFNMTASVSPSDFVPTVNGKVTITQVVNGVVGGQQNIRFRNEFGQALFTRQFAGGRAVTTELKSAADKVQDLYGILHNTSRGGSGLVATGVMGLAAVVATGGAALVVGAASTAVVGAVGAEIATLNFRGDYPIGIQIPYNSMVQAASGEKYAVRNFLIPTGKKTVDEKMSHENDKPASTTFSTRDNTTGIQGTVQKMDILYDAGEESYMVKIVFAPIDAII